jgi:hypothetical protein
MRGRPPATPDPTAPPDTVPVVGRMPLTLMDAMGHYFASNPCIGQGDLRAAITLEALQRTETQDYWIVNRKQLSRADVMELMLDMVASGYSIPALLAVPGMPKARTVMNWISDYKTFADLMETAEKMRAIILAEQALEIVDEPDPSGKQTFHQKTRADLRIRMAESMYAKKYGKKQTVDVTHHDDLTGPEVWSRLQSVLTVHQALIEEKTGIKILLPAQGVAVVDAEVEMPTDDIPTLGMQGDANPSDDWNSDLRF